MTAKTAPFSLSYSWDDLKYINFMKPFHCSIKTGISKNISLKKWFFVFYMLYLRVSMERSTETLVGLLMDAAYLVAPPMGVETLDISWISY